MKLVAAFLQIALQMHIKTICTGSLSKFKTCSTKDLSTDHWRCVWCVSVHMCVCIYSCHI